MATVTLYNKKGQSRTVTKGSNSFNSYLKQGYTERKTTQAKKNESSAQKRVEVQKDKTKPAPRVLSSKQQAAAKRQLDIEKAAGIVSSGTKAKAAAANIKPKGGEVKAATTVSVDIPSRQLDPQKRREPVSSTAKTTTPEPRFSSNVTTGVTVTAPPTVYGPDALGKKANDAAVNHLYNAYFGRDATAQELANWGSRGGSDTTVRALETFLQGEQKKYGLVAAGAPPAVLPGYVQPGGTIQQGGAVPGDKGSAIQATATPAAPAIPAVSAATTPPGPGDQLTGVYKELYDAAKSYLDELKLRGQVVNGDIEITPEKVAEFMKRSEGDLGTFLPYASKEILPYYQNQLKVAREGFLTDLGYSRDQVLRNELDLERQYGRAVRSLGEGAAESGFALSGVREREERELAGETQRNIESNRRQLTFGAQQAARQFAGTFGTAQTPAFTIGGAPRVSAGETSFARAPEEALYNLSDETYKALKGSQEFEQEAAIRSRASGLEEAFRQGEQIKLQRKLYA